MQCFAWQSNCCKMAYVQQLAACCCLHCKDLEHMACKQGSQCARDSALMAKKDSTDQQRTGKKEGDTENGQCAAEKL